MSKKILYERESRFSERVLMRELNAIKKQIITVKRNGARIRGKKSTQEFTDIMKKLTKTAEQLECDIDFLVRYRSYLNKEIGNDDIIELGGFVEKDIDYGDM